MVRVRASSPPVRRRVPRAERARTILAAADRVFAERGYHAASMDDIAARVGIAKPMLYRLFGSKEGLYAACVERAGGQLVERLRAAGSAPDAEQRFRRGAGAFFAFVAERRDGWTVLHREGQTPNSPVTERVAAVRLQVAETIGELLTAVARERGADPPAHADAVLVGLGVVGAGESLANWWVDHQEVAPDAMAARLTSLVWPGVQRAT